MSATHVVVEGTVRPDGSLELDSKLELPPGRVQLIVQPLLDLPEDDPFWQMMKGIWAARKRAGLTPRDTDEVEEQRRALREDADEEIENAVALQEESRQLRQDAAKMPRKEQRLSASTRILYSTSLSRILSGNRRYRPVSRRFVLLGTTSP
jgi:hypothetical protein